MRIIWIEIIPLEGVVALRVSADVNYITIRCRDVGVFFIVKNDFSPFLYPYKFLSFFYLIRSC